MKRLTATSLIVLAIVLALTCTTLADESLGVLPVVPVTITPGTRLVLQKDLQFKYGNDPVATDGVTMFMYTIDDIDDIRYPRVGSNTAIIRAGSVYLVRQIVNNSTDPNFFVMGLVCRSNRGKVVEIELPSIDTATVDANAIIGMFKVMPAVRLAEPDRSVITPAPRQSGGY